MPVISCYEGFDISSRAWQKYFSVIEKAINGVKRVELFFQGVIFSPSCIMIKGFPLNEQLEVFRDNLRRHFGDTDLEQSLDKRYKLVTAHSTVVRFKKPIVHMDKMLELMDKYKDRVFGRTVFDHVDFVFNDWYQREEHVRILKRFEFED
jgi:2'-5' RNA ligase